MEGDRDALGDGECAVGERRAFQTMPQSVRSIAPRGGDAERACCRPGRRRRPRSRRRARPGFVTPRIVRSPVMRSLSSSAGSIDVLLNVISGCFSPSKKSSLCRWPVSWGSSVLKFSTRTMPSIGGDGAVARDERAGGLLEAAAERRDAEVLDAEADRRMNRDRSTRCRSGSGLRLCWTSRSSWIRSAFCEEERWQEHNCSRNVISSVRKHEGAPGGTRPGRHRPRPRCRPGRPAQAVVAASSCAATTPSPRSPVRMRTASMHR